MKELIDEYRETLRAVEWAREEAEEKAERRLLGEIAGDLKYSIKWMTTGREPGNRRGVENLAAYQREIPWSCLSHNLQRTLEMRESRKKTLTVDEDQFLNSALELLTGLEKDAFIAVRGHCLSFSQAAHLLCCSKSSVQSYVKRAEGKLRDAYEKGSVQMNLF